MACTCVPHIVLHVSCRTRTSGGYFRPSEVRFRAKIPLSSHWFYNVKTQKTQFLQNRAWEMAEIENIHCPICTQPIPSSWQNGLPPALATDERRGGGGRGGRRPKGQCDHVVMSNIPERGTTSPTPSSYTTSEITLCWVICYFWLLKTVLAKYIVNPKSKPFYFFFSSLYSKTI